VLPEVVVCNKIYLTCVYIYMHLSIVKGNMKPFIQRSSKSKMYNLNTTWIKSSAIVPDTFHPCSLFAKDPVFIHDEVVPVHN